MPNYEEETWRRIAPEDRARQFMPFAALRGYYDLVREAEYVPPHHRRTQPQAQRNRRAHKATHASKRHLLRWPRLPHHHRRSDSNQLRLANHPDPENHHQLQRPLGAEEPRPLTPTLMEAQPEHLWRSSGQPQANLSASQHFECLPSVELHPYFNRDTSNRNNKINNETAHGQNALD